MAEFVVIPENGLSGVPELLDVGRNYHKKWVIINYKIKYFL